MSGSDSRESRLYSKLGASSSKEGVHRAFNIDDNQNYFAQVQEDVCGDDNYYSLLHADGAGTKSIIAYIYFRETGDPACFRGLAQDSLVMNLDDIACVNAFESLCLSNCIGRNKQLIPDSVLKEVFNGYCDVVEKLRAAGVEITLSGGETADLGDLVRTIVVDSTLFARVKKKEIIDTSSIGAGDIIIGLSSLGQAAYEDEANSGLGSNGFTLARHALISNKYLSKYPEIADPSLDPSIAYQGTMDLLAQPEGLKDNLAKSMLSPTRTYAPVLKQVIDKLGQEVHGIIHCTGGGQSKICRFGQNKKYIKDSLFPCPPICKLIQENTGVPWQEMYTVFNMGHRMEIVCAAKHLQTVCEISDSFGIEAKQIGRVEDSVAANEVHIQSEFGEFSYP